MPTDAVGDLTSLAPSTRVGIIGGAFNPVHFGHLLMAETALEQFCLDRVIWVPTYHPPHKSQDLLAFDHRWQMVQLAIANHCCFVASDVERNEDVSYTVSTLRKLQNLSNQALWYWITGIDAFQSLPTWRNSVEVANRCTWLVAPRPDQQVQQICQTVTAEMAAQAVELHWHVLQMPQTEVSSSLIRQYCQEGRSLRYLVPECVRVYINTNNLYKRL